MSSSGLIFAVIVGAWAAYLVPMWLRRQDELNESRPTERFSTALRLLTRRRAQAADEPAAAQQDPGPADEAAVPSAASVPAADVRSFAEPVTAASSSPTPSPASPSPSSPQRNAARARVLARRRRTSMALFVAFTLGGIFAVAGGPSRLWVPAVPALLLIAYLAHVRRQENRRYAVALDRRRAEEAARRLRERPRPSPAPVPEQPARAVVEQTDHAEWVDQQRRRTPAPEDEPDSWDPAPVPLPT
ncbi:hypothetical protein RM780_20465, partial [Streptomyces sp. DSM 44917]